MLGVREQRNEFQWLCVGANTIISLTVEPEACRQRKITIRAREPSHRFRVITFQREKFRTGVMQRNIIIVVTSIRKGYVLVAVRVVQ